MTKPRQATRAASHRSRLGKPWRVLAIAVLVGTFVALLIYTGTSGATYSSDETLAAPPAAGGDWVALRIRATDVDVPEGAFQVLGTPIASGEFGEPLDNGTYITRGVQFNFDVFEGETTLLGLPGEVITGRDLALRLEGNADTYPFDTYNAQLIVAVQQTEGETRTTALYVYDSLDVVPGFDIESSQVPYLTAAEAPDPSIAEDQAAGVAQIEWYITRSGAVIAIVLLIGLLMITGLVVSSAITFAIFRGRRPPSINTLAWLAAFVFALFSIRQQMPGDPGNGVLFDRLVFLPTVLGLVLLIAINTVLWATRDDWDMENPIHALRGRRHDEVESASSAPEASPGT